MARVAVFVWMIGLGVSSAWAASKRPAPAWTDVAGELRAGGVVERFLEASRAMLGTPYENGPLGEGPGATDPDPRVDFGRVDCVTYLEQAMALAITPDPSGPFLENLDAIRYDRGRVDFASRKHYMVTDWIPGNGWALRDVTVSLAPGTTETVTRTIDRAEFLRGHGVEPRADRDTRTERELTYVPTAALPRVADAIRAGDLIFWVGRGDGIFVVHTGLAVRDADGALLFRHGSSRAGKVVDESLADYAANAGFAIGFLVLRLNEDAPARLAASREGASDE